MGRPKNLETVRDPTAVAIGERIRQARDHRRLKQHELIARMRSGWGVSRLSNYENGNRMVSPQDVLAIAKALGVWPAWLMCLTDDESPELVHSSEERKLLELYRQADPSQRQKTVDRLAALALLRREAVEDARLADWEFKGEDPRPKAKPSRKRVGKGA